jgi:Fic family protein
MSKDEKNLAELFGSSARVRILKFFLNNPEEKPNLADIIKKTRVSQPQCKRELNKLIRLGLLKTTTYAKEKTGQASKKKRSTQARSGQTKKKK